jgi:hypothetical protein
VTDILSRGRALLAQYDEPAEDGGTATVPPLSDDAECGPSETDLLTQLCALTQQMIDRVSALERAMAAPRVRIPVRDMTGKIVSVSDQIVGPTVVDTDVDGY